MKKIIYNRLQRYLLAIYAIAALSIAGITARAQAYIPTPYEQVVLNDNPLAFYPLTTDVDPSDSPAAHDITANHNDGQYSGGAGNINSGSGPSVYITGGGSFNGSTGFIDLSTGLNTSILNFGGQITMEAWVQPAASGQNNQWGNILAKGADSSNNEMWLRLNQGSKLYEGGIYNPSLQVVSALAAGPATASWTHVVSTYDGTAWSLYVNGVLANKTVNNNGPLNFTNAWAIGNGTGGGNTRFFTGNIAEVALYTNALTPLQVAQHYFEGTTGSTNIPSIPPTALAHRYSFTSDASDSIGGAAWNGTLPNGGTFANGQLTLSSNSSQYVQLPAGVLGDYPAVTIESWVTFPNQLPVNCCYYSFGNTDGSGLGANYLFCAPRDGRVSISGVDPGYTAEFNASASTDFSFHTNLHIVAVYSPQYYGQPVGSGYVTLYTNGVLAGINSSSGIPPLVAVNDVLNYIGHSLYTLDPACDLTVDEFRVWGGTLDSLQVAALDSAGPDTVNTNYGSVTSLQLNVSTLQLPQNRHEPVSVTARASGIPKAVDISQYVACASDNTNVFTVLNNVIYAVSQGSANLIATYGGISATQTITVVAPLPPNIIFQTDFDGDAGEGNLNSTNYFTYGAPPNNTPTNSPVVVNSGVLPGVGVSNTAASLITVDISMFPSSLPYQGIGMGIDFGAPIKALLPTTDMNTLVFSADMKVDGLAPGKTNAAFQLYGLYFKKGSTNLFAFNWNFNANATPNLTTNFTHVTIPLSLLTYGARSEQPQAIQTLADFANTSIVSSIDNFSVDARIIVDNYLSFVGSTNATLILDNVQLTQEAPLQQSGAFLTISNLGGGNVRISWTGSGTLQTAQSLTGPWQDAEVQTNPQTVTVTGLAAFFRLR